MTKLNKLAKKLEIKLAQAAKQTFLSLAGVAKATGALARMSNLFDNAEEIDIYEGTGKPKALISMLDSAARNIYLKAYQQGAGRSEVAGAVAKMMDMVEQLNAAAQNTKGEKGPLDPQFWSKLADVKNALALVVPVDMAPQVPVARPVEKTKAPVEPFGNAKPMGGPVGEGDMTDPQRYQTQLDPQLSNIVDQLMQDKDKPSPWEKHWEDFLK